MAENFEQENIKINFDSNAKEAAKDSNALGASIDGVTQATNENAKAVKQEDQAYKALKTQLREANMELQKSIQLYGETSEQTIKAAKHVADLKDQIGFAKDISEQFNPDQKMKALGAATQIAATGMQGVTAGMALFGDQSKDTQEMLLKVQAAMAFSDAVSNLSNLGDQFKIFQSVISDTYTKIVAAKKADIALTQAATVQQRILNAVAKANPYVLLASAIAAVGIATYAWIKASKEAAAQNAKTEKANASLTASLNNMQAAIADVNSETTFQTNQSIAMAQAQGKSADEIRKLTLSLAEQETQQKKLNSQKADALVIEAELALRNSKADEETQARLKETLNKAIEFSQEQAKILSDSYKNQRKIIVDNEIAMEKEKTDRRQAAEEKQKSERQKAADEAENLRKKQAEELQKALDDQRKADEDRKFIVQKAIEEASEALNNRLMTEQEIEVQAVRDKYFLLLEEAKTFGLDKQALEDEQANAINDINVKWAQIAAETNEEKNKKIKEQDDAALAAKKANNKQLVDSGEQLIKNVQTLAGKNKGIQKAAIVADGAISLGKAAVNTAEAVTKDLAKGFPASVPLVAADILVGATSAAAIIMNTNKALQAVGGGSMSGGGGGGAGGAAAAMPQAQPTVAFNNTAENQIGQSVAQAQAAQPPLQVFVAESDITTSQNNVQALVRTNTFP